MTTAKEFAIYANGQKTRTIKVKTLDAAYRHFNKYAKQKPVTIVESTMFLGMMAWRREDGTVLELRMSQAKP